MTKATPSRISALSSHNPLRKDSEPTSMLPWRWRLTSLTRAFT
jgi:hypothetical protein